MAKKSTCIVDMNALMRFIQSFLKETRNSQGDIHLTCCQETADRFDLWDETDGFPVWLSRIIAGEMNDMGIEH